MSALAMNPVDGREVLHCECGLVQFRTSNGQCRRCHAPFETAAPKPVIIRRGVEVAPVKPITIGAPNNSLLSDSLSHLLRVIREVDGLSQEGLAIRMKCKRTWISKVERGTVVPNLSTIYRFCDALKLRPDALMEAVEIGAR
jgi:ribosome-binding protein aMBF1 (putative translation factor)